MIIFHNISYIDYEFFTALIVVLIGLIVLVSVWVYRDAERRGMNATMWVLIVLIGGCFGCCIYIIIRADYPVLYPYQNRIMTGGQIGIHGQNNPPVNMYYHSVNPYSQRYDGFQNQEGNNPVNTIRESRIIRNVHERTVGHQGGSNISNHVAPVGAAGASAINDKTHVISADELQNDNNGSSSSPNYCAQCGAALQLNAKFCSYCGYHII